METVAVFYLMFRLFKIDLMLKEMLFASVIMGFVSYTLRAVYHFPNLDVPLQLILTLAFVWMLFRIHLFYATIMTGMTFQAYFLIQSVYYYLMKYLQVFSSGLPVVTGFSTFALQIVSVLSAVAVGWWISRSRKGFDFVPDNPRGKIRYKKRDKILFILILPSYVSLAAVIYLTEILEEFYFVITLLYGIMLYGYIHFSYKRDRQYDD